MEADKIDKFLVAYEHKFPEYKIPINKLLNLPPEKETLLLTTHFRSPRKILLVSIFLGVFGIDRFLINDIAAGICKLLTGGGFGLWWLIDLFLITGATKRKNMELMEKILL